MYRFLIIEDDDATAAAMQGLIDRYLNENDVEATVERMASTLDFLAFKQRWDLVFMDIGLPGINGMEAAEELRKHDEDTLLVFVTDLAQYAIHGYSVGALDFVLKPVSYRSLAMRLDRALKILEKRVSTNICLTTRFGTRVFPAKELVYAEVRGHNLAYHLEGETIVMRGSISQLEGEMNAPQFIRISNSHLVNADHIHSIEGNDMRMSTGEVLTITRTKKKSALAALANYYGGGY